MKNRIAILIEEKYGDMRSSEKQAADYVLAHMDKVRELSLEKLAANSGVSQPTIVRMTKALGFKGYKEFRYAVVEQLAGKRTAGQILCTGITSAERIVWRIFREKWQ